MAPPNSPDSPFAPAAPRPLTIEEPEIAERRSARPRRQPLWYVILHDDDLHTYEYVVLMLMKLFPLSMDQAFAHAVEVDTEGVTIVARLPKDEAADKRDQIMRFGGDPWMKTDVSMKASIEPCDD